MDVWAIRPKWPKPAITIKKFIACRRFAGVPIEIREQYLRALQSRSLLSATLSVRHGTRQRTLTGIEKETSIGS